MTAISSLLIIFALIVVGLCIAVAVYALHRADQARASAEASRIAAEHARRYCDGLLGLLADLSPSARRAVLAARANEPIVTLARLHSGRLHGERFEEVP